MTGLEGQGSTIELHPHAYSLFLHILLYLFAPKNASRKKTVQVRCLLHPEEILPYLHRFIKVILIFQKDCQSVYIHPVILLH